MWASSFCIVGRMSVALDKSQTWGSARLNGPERAGVEIDLSGCMTVELAGMDITFYWDSCSFGIVDVA